jgi:ATP-binding cassette subfamily B protein
MKHLKALNKYFWKYRVRLLAGILFIILSNYFAILAPQITAYVVDKVQQLLPGGHIKSVAKQTDPLVNLFLAKIETFNWSFSGIVAFAALTILLLALIRGFFMFLMRQTIIVMSRHIEYDLKNEVYAHYQQLDARFYSQHSIGDLMNRISEDVSRARMYAGPAVMYLINLVTVIIFCVYNMLGKNVELTLYTLAPLPLLAITVYYVNTIIHRKSEKIQALLSDLTTNAQQSYSGIRVIKSYRQEKPMLEYFDKNSEVYRENAIALAKVEAIYFPSNLLLIGVSTLLTIMIGGLYYLNGKISEVGVIVEFILYINMLTFPVSAIGWVASMVQRASASQKRINEFLQTKPSIRDDASVNDFSNEAGIRHIEFRNVSFTFPDTGIRAVNHVSLSINKGQRIAIIGKTGSGKSTLLQLLLRMHDVNEGAVMINGKDVRSYTLKELRKMISFVPQDVFLFSETVENNIRFGNETATREVVVKAAEMAAVAGEIDRFENQYETMIGERGVTLSGGQKQRISIARALIKDSSVILFDDCLSAVDTKTEKEVLRHLDDYLTEKTAIIVTHRIFSLMHFDQVIVMDEGKIMEQGTHDELIALNGLYAEQFKAQQISAE